MAIHDVLPDLKYSRDTGQVLPVAWTLPTSSDASNTLLSNLVTRYSNLITFFSNE